MGVWRVESDGGGDIENIIENIQQPLSILSNPTVQTKTVFVLIQKWVTEKAKIELTFLKLHS